MTLQDDDYIAMEDARFDTTGFGFFAADLPDFDAGPLDLIAYFGFDEARRDHRFELEIGSGKGTFLVQQAPLQPETNFLGIEYARLYARSAADRLRRLNLSHVRMLHGEAGLFLRNYIKPDTLDKLHIYFPDPWPKKRHNKRRLIQESFLREIHPLLKSQAIINIATDHEGYFSWIEEHAAATSDLYERIDFQRPESAGEGELVGTNFERKYRATGDPNLGRGGKFQGLALKRLI